MCEFLRTVLRGLALYRPAQFILQVLDRIYVWGLARSVQELVLDQRGRVLRVVILLEDPPPGHPSSYERKHDIL